MNLLVLGYKVNVKKPVTFLSTNNESLKREIQKKISYNFIKKNKITRNKVNQGGERPVH